MTRRTLEIAAFCAALLLAALIFHAWLAAHDDQLRLSSTLATQKQALDAALAFSLDAAENRRATPQFQRKRSPESRYPTIAIRFQ